MKIKLMRPSSALLYLGAATEEVPALRRAETSGFDAR
jgi:hypothetical protein